MRDHGAAEDFGLFLYVTERCGRRTKQKGGSVVWRCTEARGGSKAPGRALSERIQQVPEQEFPRLTTN